MIPPLAALLEEHAKFARFRRIDPRRDEALIAEALHLAAELAGRRIEDEPAAMLFALSLRWNALGAAWKHFPVVYARNLAAVTLGAHL